MKISPWFYLTNRLLRVSIIKIVSIISVGWGKWPGTSRVRQRTEWTDQRAETEVPHHWKLHSAWRAKQNSPESCLRRGRRCLFPSALGSGGSSAQHQTCLGRWCPQTGLRICQDVLLYGWQSQIQGIFYDDFLRQFFFVFCIIFEVLKNIYGSVI